MRFCVLRSGSSGNCAFLEHGDTRILIDAGFSSMKAGIELLDELPCDPVPLSGITGILITHLHSDHINISTLRFARQHGLKLWIHSANASTFSKKFGAALRDGIEVNTFALKKFAIDSLAITPFMLSHDARKSTVGFRIHPADHPQSALAYAADLGTVSPSVVDHLLDAHTILLESNHDEKMLWDNPDRPLFHKKRVTGEQGHLANRQCAETLARVMEQSGTKPTTIILGHLSKDNNTPQLALDTTGACLALQGISANLSVALRDRRTEMFEIGLTTEDDC
jgi:phosphoribosyl 1,2-cyclic phosphodiesterase